MPLRSLAVLVATGVWVACGDSPSPAGAESPRFGAPSNSQAPNNSQGPSASQSSNSSTTPAVGDNLADPGARVTEGNPTAMLGPTTPGDRKSVV